MNAIRMLCITLLMLTAVWANDTWAQVGSPSVEQSPAAGVTTPVKGSDAPSDWGKREDPSPWKPAFLNLTLPVGTGKTVTVVYVPERRMENVSIHITSPSAAVVVEPSKWDVLEKDVPVKLTVLVSTPPGATVGEHFDADLSISHAPKKARNTGDSPFGATQVDREEHDHHHRLLIAIAVTANTNPLSNVTVYANPASPDVMGFDTESGYFVSLFGPRDSQGNATGFNELTAVQASTESSMTFDSTGRPLQVLLSDGHVLVFTWTSTIQAQVQILDANANLITTVPLTFSAQGAASSAVSPSNTVAIAKAFSATHPAPRAALVPAAAIVPSQTNLTVTVVTQSGDPVSDALVQGETVVPGIGIGIPLQFTAGSAPGTYLAFYPNTPSLIQLQNVEAICDSMATAVGNACAAGTVGAGIISAMVGGGCLQLALATGPGAPEVEAACLTAFGSAALVCRFKIYDLACPTIFAVPNLFVPATITVNLRAAANGASVAASVPEPGAASNATATLVLPDVCTTYTPDAGSFPITWTMTDNWTYPLSNTTAQATYTQSMPDPVAYIGDLGLNTGIGFQSCKGAFTPAYGQWIQQPTSTNFFTYTWTASLDASGTLTITEAGVSNTAPLGFYDGDTVTSYSATENATWTFNIPTGVYNITQTDSQSITFIDSSGNTVVGSETGSGGTSGAVPVIASSTPL